MWIAYHQLSPITPDRADLRAGIIAATVANSQRTRQQRAWKPEDFTLEYEPRPQRMSDKEMQARILSVSPEVTYGQA